MLSNVESYIARCVRDTVYELFSGIVPRNRPDGTDRCPYCYLPLIRDCSELSESACEASEEEEEPARKRARSGGEQGRRGARGEEEGLERNEMTNVDGMRIHPVLVCRATFPRPLPEV